MPKTIETIAHAFDVSDEPAVFTELAGFVLESGEGGPGGEEGIFSK